MRMELIFGGEYLNDLKWNDKGYDYFNNIMHEIKHGKGLIKKYHKSSYELLFEGEYIFKKVKEKEKNIIKMEYAINVNKAMNNNIKRLNIMKLYKGKITNIEKENENEEDKDKNETTEESFHNNN